jgi:hypothetical protein
VITHVLYRQIQDATAGTEIPAEVLAGIVEAESHGNAMAYRPEEGYRWAWDIERGKTFRRLTPGEASSSEPPDDFPGGVNEWLGQRASYGLCQVMGATAREAGFSGDFRELYRPRVNLDLAVRHLRQLYARHDGNLFDAIASYHAGDPRSTRAVTYAHRVLALAMHYREVERE